MYWISIGSLIWIKQFKNVISNYRVQIGILSFEIQYIEIENEDAIS